MLVVLVLGLGLAVLSGDGAPRPATPGRRSTETWPGPSPTGTLSQRVSPVAGGTEVGQLGKAFNTMIDEIEVAFAERAASEDRLRRFLADASHELRTPLTSILGYAELFDPRGGIGRDDLVPGSLLRPHPGRGVTRMGTLVDDRSPAGPTGRPAATGAGCEPVDLADLVGRARWPAEATCRPPTARWRSTSLNGWTVRGRTGTRIGSSQVTDNLRATPSSTRGCRDPGHRGLFTVTAWGRQLGAASPSTTTGSPRASTRRTSRGSSSPSSTGDPPRPGLRPVRRGFRPWPSCRHS